MNDGFPSPPRVREDLLRAVITDAPQFESGQAGLGVYSAEVIDRDLPDGLARVRLEDVPPHGGRPTTNDDLEIRYARVGDKCFIEVRSDGSGRLYVLTESLPHELCDPAAPQTRAATAGPLVLEASADAGVADG